MRLNRIPYITALARQISLRLATGQHIPHLRLSAHPGSFVIPFPALCRHSLCDAFTIRDPQIFSPLLAPSVDTLPIVTPGVTPGYLLGGLYG